MRKIELKKISNNDFKFYMDGVELPFGFNSGIVNDLSTFHQPDICENMCLVMKHEIASVNETFQLNISEEETQEILRLMDAELREIWIN